MRPFAPCLLNRISSPAIGVLSVDQTVDGTMPAVHAVEDQPKPLDLKHAVGHERMNRRVAKVLHIDTVAATT